MRRRLSAREKRTLAAVGVLALGILWMYTAFIAGPLMSEVADLGKQVGEAKEELMVLEAATTNEAALREQQVQLQNNVKSLRELLPDEEELPQIIELLSDLASQSQVKIQTIFPQRPASNDDDEDLDLGPVVYRDVLIQIDAQTGFHQLGAFLSLLEAGEKPMQVYYLKISSNPREPRRARVKLLVQAFFAAKGAAATGGGAT